MLKTGSVDSTRRTVPRTQGAPAPSCPSPDAPPSTAHETSNALAPPADPRSTDPPPIRCLLQRRTSGSIPETNSNIRLNSFARLRFRSKPSAHQDGRTPRTATPKMLHRRCCPRSLDAVIVGRLPPRARFPKRTRVFAANLVHFRRSGVHAWRTGGETDPRANQGVSAGKRSASLAGRWRLIFERKSPRLGHSVGWFRSTSAMATVPHSVACCRTLPDRS